MFFTKNGFIILSAELSTLPKEENSRRTDEMRERLVMGGFTTPKLSFIEANGVYKGVREKSFMVEVKNHYDFLWVTGLASSFSQESILMVDKRNQAALFYLKSKETEKLGTFHKIPKSVADTLDAYTETEGGYYAC